MAKENFISIVPKGRIAISAMSLPFFCPLSKLMYEEEQSQGYNIRTMCTFTNFSSNNFFRFFVKYPISPYESYLSRHTSESLKNFVKILETRLQSSKNVQKWITNLKKSWCRQKNNTARFSIAFLCSILEPSTENIKHCWDKTVLWPRIFLKIFSQKSETTFSKQFCPNIFLCFLF